MLFKLACMSATVLVLAGGTISVRAQPQSALRKQAKDNAPTQNLSASELAALGDPLFNLVLKDNPGITNLAKIEDLIQPDPNKRSTFVVDENIADPTPGQNRRSVLTFSGSNRGELLDANVMLSIFFDSNDFSDSPAAIEAWGWDNRRGRYNYYKLDTSDPQNPQLSWKFRGSSDRADLLRPAERIKTCMACHLNGGPVMKELARPWNNWHSLDSAQTYLTTVAPPSVRWPVANSVRLKDGRLKGAEDLETANIIPAISQQFNPRRINDALVHNANGDVTIDSQGFAQVLNGKRLLRPVFVTTEYNIISSRQKSGLHPFPQITTSGPQQDIMIPATFFLNANLLTGGTVAGFKGLGVTQAQEFSKFSVRSQEYKQLVIDSRVQLGSKRPGDADFAWLVPEPSLIDNDLTDRLVRRGIITPEFLAAVMSIDLENPILSPARESLLQFVPDKFSFKQLSTDPLTTKRHPDGLTKQVIANLERSHPQTESAAGKFLIVLKSADPLKTLKQKVADYHQRTKRRLDEPQSRPGELKRLHDLAVQRRKMVLDHPVLGTINETSNRLFPIP
jgi:hypothetical protein